MKIEKEENKMITDPCKDKKRAPEKKVALDAAIVYQAQQIELSDNESENQEDEKDIEE